MKVKKAEITAFLSLIVVLLISFIFGIIEITVIQTEKNLSGYVLTEQYFPYSENMKAN